MNPQPFGKYQLLKKLATGGMAEVWLARQTGIEGFAKNLVVKRILPHLAEDHEFVEMFRNEALIAARFTHPNIAQVYEFGEANGTYYIAMEFIHGEDLGRVMRKAYSTEQWIARPLAIRIVASACEGLYYAHTRTDDAGRPLKVVHRDISPQNILISFDGSVKLVDFGIAKAADQVGLTKSGAIKGKFAYMAPEQASGKALDHRADIFAIGLVLYELLTCNRPLKRETELATLQAALECSIQPPSEVADVPPALDDVVMRALSKAADDRYRDARQFQLALEEALVREQAVASSVQISELMETLFAERLQEEKKSGNPEPNGEESSSSSNLAAPAPPPEEPAQARGGRAAPAVADMRWEAPPGESSQRLERPRTSTGIRPATRTSQPPSLHEEMNEYLAPQGTQVATPRRAGETPRRSTSAGQTAVARAPSRPEVKSSGEDTLPVRRTSSRPLPLETERPAPRPSRPALALEARERPSEEDVGEEDSENTQFPEPEPMPPPAPRRRTTGHISQVRPPGEPSQPPRRRTSTSAKSLVVKEPPPPRKPVVVEDDEPSSPPAPVSTARNKVGALRNSVELLKKVAVGTAAVAVAGAIFVFRDKLSIKGIDGQRILVSVDTSPRTFVTVRHSDRCGSAEPTTPLGETPLKGVDGAHIQDTLVLENVQQGIYAEEELPYGEPGETKVIKREFKMGSVQLKVTPKNPGTITIRERGQDIQIFTPGMSFDLMEGLHTLELHGEKIEVPLTVEVQVKRGDTTSVSVDLNNKTVRVLP
ncbi:serine/threonine protein kinase [Stigmatella aurantiaca]|uniref:Serine/threonine-protein kinase n=2 Tax=Stigmatella aurantiaca (strain DW4/3-1) TaxID=378806 RepID=E3FYI7_STIAD|nr:serine/threonine-protein kinase [Stigmatella aurantiaca]ADO71112.1 Serine/threonine-protein kinase [Stigmatella aurantiaca DW4/3-1]